MSYVSRADVRLLLDVGAHNPGTNVHRLVAVVVATDNPLVGPEVASVIHRHVLATEVGSRDGDLNVSLATQVVLAVAARGAVLAETAADGVLALRALLDGLAVGVGGPIVVCPEPGIARADDQVAETGSSVLAVLAGNALGTVLARNALRAILTGRTGLAELLDSPLTHVLHPNGAVLDVLGGHEGLCNRAARADGEEGHDRGAHCKARLDLHVFSDSDLVRVLAAHA